MIRFYILTLTFLLLCTPIKAENIKIFEFTETELNKLEVRKVRGADNKTEISKVKTCLLFIGTFIVG